MAINWQLFPRFRIPPPHLVELVGAFERVASEVESPQKLLKSNEVLAVVRPHLEAIGFEVESGKSTAHSIDRPVLFGPNGKPEKYFQVDAFQATTGTVLEVEAGRAVVNFQFLKDLFEACAMQDAVYLAIAVMNEYKPPSIKTSYKDFATVSSFIDTLYASGRLQLPLDGVVVIGY